MAIYSKRYYWGHKKYNSKTGLYKGEKRHSSDGTISDWMGKTIKESKPFRRG